MTPAELLLASRGTPNGSTARVSPTSCPSPSLVDERSTSRRPSAVRPCSIRISWTIGLGGRLECSLVPCSLVPRSLVPRSLVPGGLAMHALLSFEPAATRPMRSADSVPSAASIGNCEVLDYSVADTRQYSFTLRLANGQRATIEVVERGSDSQRSRYLVLTDLPAQLGFRGGTYVLNHVDVDVDE
ncbi:MAG: hypothetical protein RIR10_901 [Planctomycetota bacterium]